MSASFQVVEEAIDRQGSMPVVPDPQTLPTMAAAIAQMNQKAPERPSLFLDHQRPFEFRPVVLPDPTAEVVGDPHMKVWFKAVDRLPDDDVLHRNLLAYASDYYLLGVAGMDERLTVGRHELQMASIDHAMWFHRRVRVDEWLLYVLDSPTASGARGLARGSIFSQDGRLVASTAQEGLVRRRKQVQ
jgi:acyl-CoA thioesterase-2